MPVRLVRQRLWSGAAASVLLASRWHRRWPGRQWCEQADAVAVGQGEIRIGFSQAAPTQDGDRHACRRPADAPQRSANGRRAWSDRDLEDPVAMQRRRWLRRTWLPPGRRVAGCALPRRTADPVGEGLQDAVVGDPSPHLPPVPGQHRQAVAAVGLELAQCLRQGLVGVDRLRVTLVDEPSGQRPHAGRNAIGVVVMAVGDTQRDRERAHGVGGGEVGEGAPRGGAVDVLAAA